MSGQSGTPRRDVPATYAPWQTLTRWQRDGTWAIVLAGLQAVADAGGECRFDHRPGSPIGTRSILPDTVLGWIGPVRA